MKVSRILMLASAVMAASVASASFYSTSFEDPPFVAGGGVNGIDGWANGSGAGVGVSVSTDVAAHGTQSLKFDNMNNVSFYSVRHDLGSWPGTGVLIASVQLYMLSLNQEERRYGIYFGSAPTSTMGGIIQGVTIDGAGRIRGGTTWAATYGAAGQFAVANPGTYLNRWLTLTLTYDPGSGMKSASLSGFSDNAVYSNSWMGGAAPGNLQLGSDYDLTTNRSGIGYFDNVGVVPEPGTLIALGLGAAALAARRRRNAK